MNELVESDPELYGGDTEEMTPPMKKKPVESEREKLKAEMKGHLKKNDKEENQPGVLSSTAANDKKVLGNLFDPDEISLVDPEEERNLIKIAKEK